MLTPLGKQKILVLFAVLLFAALVAVVLYYCLQSENPPSNGSALVASVPFVVGRNSFSSKFGLMGEDKHNVSYDFSGLSASSVNAQFFSVGTSNCTEVNSEYVSQTLDQIDEMLRFFEKEEMYVTLAVSSSDVYSARRDKKLAGFLSIDGGYTIEPSVLRDYFRLGVRSVAVGAGCNRPQPNSENERDVAQPLPDGEMRLISEMNRLGVIIDLTGSDAVLQNQTIYHSTAPVAFMSSASSNLVPHPRNVEDSVLQTLSKFTDGIVMISLTADQTCQDLANCTVANVIEHINHIASIIGRNKVGIGGNLDSLDAAYPNGLSSASGYVTLFDELMAGKNWSVSELQGLAGNNFMRVMSGIENVAQRTEALRYIRPAMNNSDDILDDLESQATLLQADRDSIWMPLYEGSLANFEQKLISFQDPGTNSGNPASGSANGNPASPTATTPGTPTSPNTPTSTQSTSTTTESTSTTTSSPTTPLPGRSATIHLSSFALLLSALVLF